MFIPSTARARLRHSTISDTPCTSVITLFMAECVFTFIGGLVGWMAGQSKDVDNANHGINHTYENTYQTRGAIIGGATGFTLPAVVAVVMLIVYCCNNRNSRDSDISEETTPLNTDEVNSHHVSCCC